MREGIDLVPVRFGGTGSRSESTEQPDALPDKYESGTPNTPAIAGLLGGLTFIEQTGRPNIAAKKRAAAKKILEGLRRNDRVRVYGAPENGETLPILLMNVDGIEPSDVGYECNRAGVCVRVGLHCSPVAHRTVGTFPRGAVRISPGYFTSDADIDRLLEVVNTIAGR
jgi:selenocysteine lyase/cysteine desulfurase